MISIIRLNILLFYTTLSPSLIILLRFLVVLETLSFPIALSRRETAILLVSSRTTKYIS